MCVSFHSIRYYSVRNIETYFGWLSELAVYLLEIENSKNVQRGLVDTAYLVVCRSHIHSLKAQALVFERGNFFVSIHLLIREIRGDTPCSYIERHSFLFRWLLWNGEWRFMIIKKAAISKWPTTNCNQLRRLTHLHSTIDCADARLFRDDCVDVVDVTNSVCYNNRFTMIGAAHAIRLHFIKSQLNWVLLFCICFLIKRWLHSVCAENYRLQRLTKWQ